MQSDKNNTDDFFSGKYGEFEVDITGKTAHWQQMNNLLNGHPVTIYKKFFKRVSRRVIVYSGMVAVITTIAYFSIVRHAFRAPYKISKKEINIKNNSSIVKSNPPPVPGGNAIISKKYSTHNTKQIIAFNKTNATEKRLVKTTSDTIFENPVAAYRDINSTAVIKSFYDHLKPPVETFTIDAKRDTMLFGKNGTVIKIPARAFTNHQNKIIKSAVTITLTECYDYTSILACSLVTMAGNEQLVSGGMLKIMATADGEDVKIQPYKKLNVAMPMEVYDKEMQLFTGVPLRKQTASLPAQTKDSLVTADKKYFDDAIIDWQASGQQQAYQNVTNYIERKAIKLFDLRKIIKGEKEKYEADFLVRANDIISDDKIKNLIAKKYRGQFDRITIKRVKNFSEGSTAKNTPVMVTKTGFEAVDSIAMDFNQALQEKLVAVQDSINFMKQVTIERQQFFDKIKTDSINYVKQKQFDKTYNFDITGLGWINCDKLFKDQNDHSAPEFTLTIGDDIDKINGNYNLVFLNIRSVLPGRFENGKITFGKVPANEPVQVVCVAQKKGKAVACIKSMIVSKDAIAALKFEEMTPAIFEARVAKL